MSTILISSFFSENSAAKNVISNFTKKNKIDIFLFSGRTKSSQNNILDLSKLLRYVILFGPLFTPSLLFKLFRYLKKGQTIIFDTSHFNIMIPIIRLFYPSIKIKVIVHNNEYQFLKSASYFYWKQKRIIRLTTELIKLPYVLLIRLIENHSKCTLIYISTNDMKYNFRNEIEFLDLTSCNDSIISSDLKYCNNEFFFIGNDFFNNYNQIDEFLSLYKEAKINTYGSINYTHNTRVIRKGPYESTSELPERACYWLGSNPTGFPIKSLDYLSIKDSIIIADSLLSLNLLINPRVILTKK